MEGKAGSIFFSGTNGKSNDRGRQASLTGITLIRNGDILGYPWRQCILNLLTICDKVIVNVDPTSSDNTFKDLCGMGLAFPDKLQIVPAQWDMSNTGDGSQLALQVNNLLQLIKTDWVLYLQADELLLETEKDNIRNFLNSLDQTTTQVELYRTYFFGSTTSRLPKEEIWLGRIFRNGTHYIGGDGMYLVRKLGQVIRLTNGMIYHYSRVGSEETMNNKLRTLDRLFHDEEEIKTFPKFSFKSIDKSELIPYIGPHPRGIEEFYNGVKK